MKKRLTFIDLHGMEIQVVDLDDAIRQADSFRGAHHVPPVPSDIDRQAYWSDVYQKLLELKRKEDEQSS